MVDVLRRSSSTAERASREFVGVIWPECIRGAGMLMRDVPDAPLKNSARQRDTYTVLETAIYSQPVRTVDNVYKIYTNSKATLTRHYVSALPQSTTQMHN